MSERPNEAAPTVGHLSPEGWKRLMEITDRFEAAWPKDDGAAGTVDLTSFLPPPEDPLRPTALHELIKSDLEIRWRHGQKPTLDEYVTRFPELGALEGLPPKLLYEEYRVRQRYGDQPPLSAYQPRFPAQFAALERLVREQPAATLTGVGQTPGAATPPASRVTAPPAKPAAPARPASLSTMAGDYTLIKRIGSGGFGEVWRAEAPGGIEVAVKVIFRPLDHEEAQRELQSLELIKNLRHHYLLQTHRFWSEEDRLRIVMELADGSLRDRLKECRNKGANGIPVAELLAYMREAAEALDFLHAQKVMHRDIKPENILLVGRHVKVADFGLARLQQSQRSATASGSGTPAYMAPEIWRGKVHQNSDQYSLAIAYIELRLDRRPFAGGDMMELMFNHIQNKPDLAPLPASEQEVLHRALSKDPGARFANCLEFVHALEDAVARDQGQPVPHYTAPGLGASDEQSPTPTSPPSRDMTDPMNTLVRGVDGPVPVSTAATEREVGPTSPPRLKTWKDAREPAIATAAPTKKGKSRLFAAAVVVLFVATGAGLALWLWRAPGPRPGPKEGSFSLAPLPPQTLRAGARETVDVGIARENFAGPVEITLADLPAGVTAATGTISDGAASVPVELAAGNDATLGSYEVTVHAVGSGVRQSGKMALVIEANVYLPPLGGLAGVGKWVAVKQSGKDAIQQGGRTFERQIDFVFNDGVRVPFVLIPPGGDDLPPFYIMQNKVTNALFARFAATGRVRNPSWKEGALGGGKTLGIAGREEYPVFNVDVRDAARFAAWMGGRLPSPQEWDKAAGKGLDKNLRGPGPFRAPLDEKKSDEIAINRGDQGPLPSGRATKDISYFEVHDMAGNGMEWTRRVMELDDLAGEVPLPEKASYTQDRVILRGKSWVEPAPLLFSSLEDRQDTNSEAYTKTSPETSFRIVIEPAPQS